MPLGQVPGCHLVVGRAAGDSDDQVVRVVVRRLKIDAVDAVEHNYREPPQPFVAINQRVVDDDGLQQCAGLGIDVRVGVPSEDAGAGAVGREV